MQVLVGQFFNGYEIDPLVIREESLEEIGENRTSGVEGALYLDDSESGVKNDYQTDPLAIGEESLEDNGDTSRYSGAEGAINLFNEVKSEPEYGVKNESFDDNGKKSKSMIRYW